MTSMRAGTSSLSSMRAGTSSLTSAQDTIAETISICQKEGVGRSHTTLPESGQQEIGVQIDELNIDNLPKIERKVKKSRSYVIYV